MLLSEILSYLGSLVPFALQENYDNSGLIIGSPQAEITKALVCVDVTEEVIDECLSLNGNLIISHHPMVFTGLKRFTGSNLTERLVTRCIREDIAVMAMHTNLDNYMQGVNRILCDKIGIRNARILRPVEGLLRKLVTFCPQLQAEALRTALFSAGAGQIGNYDSCSFNTAGQGTFRALPGANPFVGEIEKLHQESEERIEVIFPAFLEKPVLAALLSVHPYEEVAYDIYTLSNSYPQAGAGMIGELETPVESREFLQHVKKTLSVGCIRHTLLPAGKISKIAVCGGSGSFLIRDALTAGADAFLTGDIKYHDFFIPENRLLLADIGHYESEQYTKELIYTLLKKKFPTFALQISRTITNPVNYL